MSSIPLALAAALALAPPPPAAAAADHADDWYIGQLPGLLELYRHLHAHPELSLREAETAKRIAEELEGAGAKVTRGVGGHGVVGVIANGRGPTILFRCDLDALPVVEETGLPFASKVKVDDDAGESVGVMHACGHDIHMTVLVGLARWLSAHKGEWSGTALLVAQPAEERVMGAKAMLADGLYERFGRPDRAVALHVAADLEAGKLGYAPGPALAGSTAVDVIVKGKGGHGAIPHKTVDPVVLAASLVMELQTIVSREVAPIEPAVITVGSIQGGTKHNIIPDQVRLQLTLRAFSDATRDLLIDGIRRRGEGLAHAHKAPKPEVTVAEGTPPTINDPALIEQLRPALEGALGAASVLKVEPTMGAEDFGLYSLGGEIPAAMFWLGAVPPRRWRSRRRRGPPSPRSTRPASPRSRSPAWRRGSAPWRLPPAR
jgi:amidohydrolase